MTTFKESSNKITNWIIFLDFLLVGISFYIVYYSRTKGFYLSIAYQKLLVTYYVFWIVINYFEKKYLKLVDGGILNIIMVAGKTSIYLLFLVSFVTVLMQLSDFSRQQVFGSCIILFILESCFFSIYYLINSGITEKDTKKTTINRSQGFSVPRLILDATLLAISFIIINYIRRDSFTISTDFLLIG